MDSAGVGISLTAAQEWLNFDAASYNEAFIEADDEYAWFIELPDWAYDPTEGPFYIDDEGAIWGVSTRPSQSGILIGNLA